MARFIFGAISEGCLFYNRVINVLDTVVTTPFSIGFNNYAVDDVLF